MRFEYQGYSWGFRVTVRLDFIEGTPPQDPVDVRNVYNGTFAYGSHQPTPSTATCRPRRLLLLQRAPLPSKA